MQSTPVLGSATARAGTVKAAALAAILAVAALGAAACGTSTQATTANGSYGQAAAAVPQSMAVSCGPNQRAVVKSQVIDGVPTTSVQCLAAVDGSMALAPTSSPQPVAQPLGAWPADTFQPTTAAPAARAQAVSYRTDGNVVTYVPRARRTTRSVQKSALIIGSSAGVGAGVGAAIGGKKGALIGAAIGGGGATIWDQVTRRK